MEHEGVKDSLNEGLYELLRRAKLSATILGSILKPNDQLKHLTNFSGNSR